MANKPSFEAKVRALMIIMAAAERLEREKGEQRARHGNVDDLIPGVDDADIVTSVSEPDESDTAAEGE